jgi:hypothetical protein
MKANVYDKGQVPDVPRLSQGGKPASRNSKAPTKTGSAAWLVPALIVLSLVPLAAGAFRLT